LTAEKENTGEMKLAKDRAEAFNLSHNSYELIHGSQFSGHMSKRVFETMTAHLMVMQNLVSSVDDFTDVEAIETFKGLIEIKEEPDGEKVEG